MNRDIDKDDYQTVTINNRITGICLKESALTMPARFADDHLTEWWIIKTCDTNFLIKNYIRLSFLIATIMCVWKIWNYKDENILPNNRAICRKKNIFQRSMFFSLPKKYVEIILLWTYNSYENTLRYSFELEWLIWWTWTNGSDLPKWRCFFFAWQCD